MASFLRFLVRFVQEDIEQHRWKRSPSRITSIHLKAKIKVDAFYEKQKLLADAIKAEGIAEAKGIKEMNDAMASVGGEALVKLEIAEALQDKKILLLPVSEGGMNLKTTDINALLNTMGIKSLSGK